jgi:hypothetical protein
MKRRISRRLNGFFKAEIISNDTSFSGFIGNFSENGIYMRISSANAGISFAPGTVFDLKFRLPSEKILNLRCKLVWVYEIPLGSQPGRSAYNMGMEIINPLPAYMDFYKDLVIKDLKKFESICESS